MTSTDVTPFSLPGTPEFTEATATFQLAEPVDPIGAFTARSVDDAVGVAGDDTDQDLTAVRSALETYLTGRTAPNYINHSEQPQRTYDDEVRARVESVRRSADPTGMFAGDVAPTHDRA